MQIETLPIADLTPYANNCRTHSDEQVQQIAASIREYGWTNPILIDEHGGIIAGHGRVLAAQHMGITEAPCIRMTGLTEEQRRAYIIADNKLALNAGWDEALLAQEMSWLNDTDFNMSLAGFSSDELSELLAISDIDPVEGCDPDDVPEEDGKGVSVDGDVWALGKHRLMCGDSTSIDAMATLMGGGMADCCWTDPPYNVAYGDAAETRNKYVGGNGNTTRILNDDMSDSDFRLFLHGFYTAACSVMKKGAAIYVAHAETERANFTAAMLETGFKLSGVAIWRKDSLVLGRSDYQWMHEPILYGWKEGAAHKWFGGRKQTTIIDMTDSPFVRMPDGRWQITIGEQVMVVDGDASVEWVEGSILRELKPKRNDIHPTMKPVALIERMLRNSSRPGFVVLDPFGGSGSTMIACERLGMTARLMELSPAFVDVIIRRWQEYTGKQASHAVTGVLFDALVNA